jgi:hypothetical protein
MTINTSFFSIKSWHIEFHAFSNQERRHHDSHVNIDVTNRQDISM